jgi:hypothetical protein
MTPKNDRLSLYFPGLIDVCLGEDGQLVYLIADNGQFLIQETAMTDEGEVKPSDKTQIVYQLPRAHMVMEYLNRNDTSLYRDVVTYLKRFSALDDPQWSVVATYIFLTYLHDHQNIDYCGSILFYAVPERGKSRTGKSVAYAAFRGIPIIEMREANILRDCRDHHGTLFFDLEDVSKKAERKECGDILLGRYEKGHTCSRVMYPERGPLRDREYFEVYGPTIFATNEQLQKILGTRCFSIIMPHRPGNYENPRPGLALELKERLTAWRGKNLYAPLTEIKPMDGVISRLWDISKPLLQVGLLANPQGNDLLKEAIFSIAGERSESIMMTIEGRIMASIMEVAREKNLEGLPEIIIKTSEILENFNKNRPDDKHVNPQWFGQKIKSMSIPHRTVKGRSEIILQIRSYWTLLDQYGLIGRDLIADNGNPTQTLPVQTSTNQGATGCVGIDRVSPEPWEEGYKSTQPPDHDENYDEEYEERAAIMEYEGGLCREEAEREAKRIAEGTGNE